MEDFVPIENVCREFGISVVTLRRYERVSSVRRSRRDGQWGFGPREVRRLWSIVSLHRELGVNLAGVELILHMRDRMLEMDRHRRELLRVLSEHRLPSEPAERAAGVRQARVSSKKRSRRTLKGSG